MLRSLLYEKPQQSFLSKILISHDFYVSYGLESPSVMRDDQYPPLPLHSDFVWSTNNTNLLPEIQFSQFESTLPDGQFLLWHTCEIGLISGFEEISVRVVVFRARQEGERLLIQKSYQDDREEHVVDAGYLLYGTMVPDYSQSTPVCVWTCTHVGTTFAGKIIPDNETIEYPTEAL